MATRTDAHTTIDHVEAVRVLCAMTIHDEHFNHRQWSLLQADHLAAAARMIRDGYGQTEVVYVEASKE